MSDGKPLHVQVAEALGWRDCRPAHEDETDFDFAWWGHHDGDRGYEERVPHFDIDWAATGPLIGRFKRAGWNVGIQCENGGDWLAWFSDIGQEKPHVDLRGRGATPLLAACNLILALKAAGKL